MEVKKRKLVTSEETNDGKENVEGDAVAAKKRRRPWRQAVRNRARASRKELEAPVGTESGSIADTKSDGSKKKKRKKKNVKKLKALEESDVSKSAEKKSTKSADDEDKPENRLEASRFRYLNEKLYTSSAKEAQAMFEEDQEAFDAYHKGYRMQVKHWPMNPVEKIILDLNALPGSSVIADVGCGDAKIAQRLGDRFTVYSFDLVAANELVTAANMSRLPLTAASVDVAVYCLSLMGTNLCKFIREANRILKVGGKLKICEVSSRFRGVQKFVEAIEKMGFSLKTKKNLKDYFLLFSFTKTENTKERRPMGLVLNPCLYKKR